MMSNLVSVQMTLSCAGCAGCTAGKGCHLGNWEVLRGWPK